MIIFVVQVLENNNNVDTRIMTMVPLMTYDLTNTTIRRNHDLTIGCNDRITTISIFQ